MQHPFLLHTEHNLYATYSIFFIIVNLQSNYTIRGITELTWENENSHRQYWAATKWEHQWFQTRCVWHRSFCCLQGTQRPTSAYLVSGSVSFLTRLVDKMDGVHPEWSFLIHLEVKGLWVSRGFIGGTPGVRVVLLFPLREGWLQELKCSHQGWAR